MSDFSSQLLEACYLASYCLADIRGVQRVWLKMDATRRLHVRVLPQDLRAQACMQQTFEKVSIVL